MPPSRHCKVASLQRGRIHAHCVLAVGVVRQVSGHSAAVAAAVVVEDTADSKRIVTTSLDKTMALWATAGGCDQLCNSSYVESARLALPGGPAFSAALDRRSDDGLPDLLYLGTHAREVVAWAPPRSELEENLVLGGHCGWVRALASAGGRWLFAAACNELYCYDAARAKPSLVGTTSLDKGDILALAVSTKAGLLFTAGADGSLRAFSWGKTGGLTPVACRPKAHADRVTAIVAADGLLFSASYDGSIKAWDSATLEIVGVAPAAHGGERVHCLTMGPRRMLYSGGGDGLVRRWSPALLQEAAAPLHAHSQSVRALAAGPRATLVSGDKGGEIAVWEIA